MQELDFIQGGNWLRERRNKAGYSLRDIEEKSGIKYATLSLIERGEQKPFVQQVYSIGLVLGFTIDDYVSACGGITRESKVTSPEWILFQAFVTSLSEEDRNNLFTFILPTSRMFIEGLQRGD